MAVIGCYLLLPELEKAGSKGLAKHNFFKILRQICPVYHQINTKFTDFYLLLPKFIKFKKNFKLTKFLPNFTITGCNWLLLSLTVSYCLLLSVTVSYWMILSVTGCYCMLLPVTVCYCLLLSVSGCYCLLLDFVVCYCLLLSFTGCYCLLLAVTGC